jgi:hypothetical protein
MQMVSPVKPAPNRSSTGNKALRELTQIHFRQHSERVAWRDQLEALRTTLHELPKAAESEDQSNRTAVLYLREKCKDLEVKLAEERTAYHMLKESLEKEKQEAAIREHMLLQALQQEKQRRKENNDRTTDLLRAVQPQRRDRHTVPLNQI